jgi:uncharacterized membrane protein (DUF485 family)
MNKRAALAELSGKRWQIAIGLTIVMMVTYFSFILLVAYGKNIINTPLITGSVTSKVVPMTVGDLTKTELKDLGLADADIAKVAGKKADIEKLFATQGIVTDTWKPVLDKRFEPQEGVLKLTLGIVLGAACIVVAWIITGFYVYWANNTYDIQIQQVKSGK